MPETGVAVNLRGRAAKSGPRRLFARRACRGVVRIGDHVSGVNGTAVGGEVAEGPA